MCIWSNALLQAKDFLCKAKLIPISNVELHMCTELNVNDDSILLKVICIEFGIHVKFDVWNGPKVDFLEGGKPKNPDKNLWTTGKTNYNNCTHMSATFF